MPRKYTIKNIGSFELPDRFQKVFLVGADTYLGGHLAKYFLRSGVQVAGCGLQEKLFGELAAVQYFATAYNDNWDFISDSHYDWVLLCHDPRDGQKKHLGILESLIEYLRHFNEIPRLCYPSTFSVCESSNGIITERSRVVPKSELDLTIAFAELLLSSQPYRFEKKIQTYILRLGDVYGDELGMGNMPGLINFYYELARAGEKIPLYGLGLQKRTIINIADVCRLIIDYLNLDFQPQLVNFPGENIRVVEIANLIAKHYNVDGYLEILQRANCFCNPYGGDQKLSFQRLRSIMPIKLTETFAQWLYKQPRSLLKASNLS